MKKIEWLIRYSMLMVSSAVVLGEQYHRRYAAMAGDYMDGIDSENGAYLGSSFMSNMTSASRGGNLSADMGIFPMLSIDQNDTDQSANRTKEYKTSVALFVFLSILYGAISFVSVTGNCLIIFVVLRNKKMKNVTNYFISNLALADVVIGMFATPFQFQAAHLQRWIFPAIMCKIVPFAATLSVNVSIITLVAISLDRYYVILYPFKQKLSVKKCIIILVGIWIVSILMSLVKLINFGIKPGPNGYPVCTPLIDKVDTIETIVLAITQYIVPFFIISFTYFRIGYHIYFDDTPESVTYNHCKNKRKVIKMIFIVVILFMICWAPIQFFNVFNVIFSDIIDTIPDIHIVWFFSNSLAVSNSCYNVFIYGACSARFKSEFKKLFRCLPCIDDDLCDFDSNARKFTYRNSCNSNMLPSTFGMTPGGGMLAHKKYSCDVTMHRNSMCAPPSNRHSSSFNERFLTRNNFKAKYLSVQNAQANTNKVTNNRASICIKEFDSKTKRTSRIDEL